MSQQQPAKANRKRDDDGQHHPAAKKTRCDTGDTLEVVDLEQKTSKRRSQVRQTLPSDDDMDSDDDCGNNGADCNIGSDLAGFIPSRKGEREIMVQLTTSSVLTAALEEVCPSQATSTDITISVTNQVPFATDCNITAFNIPNDVSQDAMIMANLPEELAREFTGVIVSSLVDGNTGVVTTAIESMSVSGLKPGEKFDVTVPVRDLLATLIKQKNKALTMYFRESGLRVVIYDMSEPSNMQTIDLCARDADGDETHERRNNSLQLDFSQCVFIHVSSLYEAVEQAKGEDVIRIKVHQLNLDGNVQRIVQITTADDNTLGVGKTKTWIINSSESDNASNCEHRSQATGGCSGDADDGGTPTQEIIHRTSMMLDMIKGLEGKAIESTSTDVLRLEADQRLNKWAAARKNYQRAKQDALDSPGKSATQRINDAKEEEKTCHKELKDLNVLHHKVYFDMGKRYDVAYRQEGKGRCTYQLLAQASFTARHFIHVLKPILNTKRIVSLLLPDEPDRYMMVFVPMGGKSKLLQISSCTITDPDE